MELYTFTLVKGACHVPMGQGTLDFGLAMYRNAGTLHEQRNMQVDVDYHLHEELLPAHMAAVSIWLGHAAFLAEPLTPHGIAQGAVPLLQGVAQCLVRWASSCQRSGNATTR